MLDKLKVPHKTEELYVHFIDVGILQYSLDYHANSKFILC